MSYCWYMIWCKGNRHPQKSWSVLLLSIISFSKLWIFLKIYLFYKMHPCADGQDAAFALITSHVTSNDHYYYSRTQRSSWYMLHKYGKKKCIDKKAGCDLRKVTQQTSGRGRNSITTLERDSKGHLVWPSVQTQDLLFLNHPREMLIHTLLEKLHIKWFHHFLAIV